MNAIQSSQNNQYLIKSLLNNQYFTIDKKDSLKYLHTLSQQGDKDFYWSIISLDQVENFTSRYSLRFGEFVQISSIKSQSSSVSKIPLLIQQPNSSIISEQSFKKLSDNLINKQPCVFLSSENNFYLTIEKDKLIYFELPNPGSYFQIIPLFENELELELDRPFINFCYEYQIRNYVTGYSLNVYSHISQLLYVTATRRGKKNETWTLIKDKNGDNKFQIANMFYKQYIHTEDLQVNLIENNPENQYWEIQTIDGKELSYGVPFIIQNPFTKYYLTMKVVNLKEPLNYEQDVIQTKTLKPTSLWIIFNHII